MTVRDLPALAEVRAYVAIPETALSDEDLGRVYESAIGVLVETCRIATDEETGEPSREGWPPALVEAALRRVQRSIAAKGLPLGYLDQASEYGPAKIPHYDSLIEELEGRYRRVVFG